ncbi:hypothetical protein ACH5RR_037005 [Cinchona calisaya]|uniref:Uncharacterized protein n=1 Tax=Cinchona calisaya TaxID=153742 RepID=A0ABD2Y769_9GENT
MVDFSKMIMHYGFKNLPSSSSKFTRLGVRHYSFLHAIKQNWDRPILGSGMMEFSLKFCWLKERLKEWNKDVFGNVFHAIQRVEEEVAIKEINYECVQTEKAIEELHAAQDTLLSDLKNKELFFQRKARIKWLGEGDYNTKFFHATLLDTRATLSIRRIKNGDGTWLTAMEDIISKGVDFFQYLLTDEVIDPQAMESLLNIVDSMRNTESLVVDLERRFEATHSLTDRELLHQTKANLFKNLKGRKSFGVRNLAVAALAWKLDS